jgi:hypothetical protein
MANGNNVSDRATRWMRWLARGIGSLLAASWWFVGIAGVLYEREPCTLESAIMAGFIITSGLGVLIAWRREGAGGAIVFIHGVLFSTFAYFSAGRNKGFAMLVSGGPFLLVGILFLATWRRSRQPGVPPNSRSRGD